MVTINIDISLTLPTTRLPTRTPFFKVLPVLVSVIHSDLFLRLYSPGSEDDPLGPQPCKLLELAIWRTRMVYEAGEVALPTLPDLVLP